MAFELAPWLQPQNFMQAINQGSQFGLNVVQTNQKAWEMDQQRQQAMATLQQNWAEKVMANQTRQDQNQAMAQNRADNLSLEGQRNQNIASHNLALENSAMSGQKQAATLAAATQLGLNTRAAAVQQGLNDRADAAAQFTPGAPVDFGNGVMALETSPGRWTRLPTTPAPKPLAVNEVKAINDLNAKSQVVTGGTELFSPSTWGSAKTTNYNTALLSPYEQTLQSNIDAKKNAYIGQPSAAPMQLQTNSVAPAMSLTNSPAAGTGVYKVGGLYGKSRYMGGDPNVPSSWRQE